MMNIFPIILYLTSLINIVLAGDYIPKDHILVNCGTFDRKTTDSDGRIWSSDKGSKYLVSSKGTFRASGKTQAPDVGRVPYLSARVMYSNATYNFPVSPGRVFLRLYFYPNVYSRSNAANAVFSVTVGSYALLRNFNVYKSTQQLDVHYLVKEYYVNVDSGTLTVTFSPSYNTFAFVNGIEVVSMPSLYDNEDGDNIIGASSPFQIENSTTLESLYRLNVGGNYIPPTKDELSRSWYDDSPYRSSYMLGVAEIADPGLSITYRKSLPSYTAPVGVYTTARYMTPDSFRNLEFNLTWLLPIDTRFAYLVRLHFCQILSNIDKVNQMVFNIYINQITAFSAVDVIALTNSNGAPYIMDFVVIMPITKDPKQDLRVELNPNTKYRPQYYNAFLNGLEIFKINNTDGSLTI
ncbi:receptor-like protein kinase FERONIA [Chenopodium quinoa]|uniref:Malectin-like domain-containing protein n=1 Tax=Chenopodium quinoa TaxID=63459 RepID=A0A803KVH3_CHEQI|nr:receptor-like protein kinase FERONIA [Chenopodium quinoa]